MGREKDLTSGALRVAPFVSPVSSRPSPSSPPESVSAASPFSVRSGTSDKQQLLLELDSASDSESASGPESSAEELESPPCRGMAFALWL